MKFRRRTPPWIINNQSIFTIWTEELWLGPLKSITFLEIVKVKASNYIKGIWMLKAIRSLIWSFLLCSILSFYSWWFLFLWPGLLFTFLWFWFSLIFLLPNFLPFPQCPLLTNSYLSLSWDWEIIINLYFLLTASIPFRNRILWRLLNLSFKIIWIRFNKQNNWNNKTVFVLSFLYFHLLQL